MKGSRHTRELTGIWSQLRHHNRAFAKTGPDPNTFDPARSPGSCPGIVLSHHHCFRGHGFDAPSLVGPEDRAHQALRAVMTIAAATAIPCLGARSFITWRALAQSSKPPASSKSSRHHS